MHAYVCCTAAEAWWYDRSARWLTVGACAKRHARYNIWEVMINVWKGTAP